MLLVTDDEQGGKILTTEIEKNIKEIKVDLAVSGESLLEFLDNFQYTLICTELSIFGYRDAELIKTLRTMNEEVFILLAVQIGQEKNAVQALKEGVDDYFIKTGSIAGLIVEKIQRVLENIHIRQIVKDLRYRLLQEQKLSSVGRLIGGIAHNISSPLTGIMGYAELIKMNSQVVREAGSILKQAWRIDEIIKSLIFKSRRAVEKQEELIDLNFLLETDLRFFEANLKFKHEVAKSYHFAEKLPKIWGKYSDLSQCLINIFGFANELMAGHKKNKLAIRTLYDAETVSMEIVIDDFGEHFKRIQLLLNSNFIKALRILGWGSGSQEEIWWDFFNAVSVIKSYSTGISAQLRAGENVVILIKFPRIAYK